MGCSRKRVVVRAVDVLMRRLVGNDKVGAIIVAVLVGSALLLPMNLLINCLMDIKHLLEKMELGCRVDKNKEYQLLELF